MRKVAILAFHYWPDEAIGSVRPENWAYWLSKDHQVSVVTRPARGHLDDAKEYKEYKVVRPFSPIIRLVDRLNDRRKQRRQQRASREPSHFSSASPQKTIIPTGAFSYRMPCLYDAWIPSAVAALIRIRPDVVIATHSPYSALVAAGIYKAFRPKVKLWLDFRDLWSTTHMASGLPFFRSIEHWVETRLLRAADAITTVSDGLADDFRSRGFAEKSFVIYNAPSVLTSKLSNSSRKSLPTILLGYTGTIYSGWRDPTPLFEMLARLDGAGLISPGQIQFCVASKNAGDLLSIAAKCGALDYLNFVGAIPRSESIRLQETSDVLVLLESGRPEAKGVLTGKVFEYLATDKPILLIGPEPGSELYEMLERHRRLISIAGLEEVLRGNRDLLRGDPVDYSDVSRAQLMAVMERLSGN